MIVRNCFKSLNLLKDDIRETKTHKLEGENHNLHFVVLCQVLHEKLQHVGYARFMCMFSLSHFEIFVKNCYRLGLIRLFMIFVFHIEEVSSKF